jgi:hypothetical protein
LSSSSDGDRPAGPGPGDPGQPRALDERAIDRALLAQLIARWGEPPRRPPLTPDEEERRALIARRDRALAAADPALVHHLERHDRDADRLAPAQPPEERWLRSIAGRPIARFDPGVWPIRPPDQLRELEPSDEVHECLEQRTPQGFLRDLHRVVLSFGDVELRRVPRPAASEALARGRDAVGEAMAQRHGGLAATPLATRLAQDGMAELRQVLSRPWADSRPETSLPLPSRAPSFEDSQWFGLSGGYDPDA